MAAANATVRYQPLRIGFLVREGQKADILKAAGYNTLVWGGINNPIIPIGSNTELAESLITFFDIDVLVPIERTPEIDLFIKKHHSLRSRDNYDLQFFSHNKRPYNIDILHIIQHHWESGIRHKPSTYKSNALLLVWDAKDIFSDIFALTFGFFDKPTEVSVDFSLPYIKGLKADTHTIANSAVLDKELYEKMWPLRLTRDLLPHKGSANSGALFFQGGIFVGEEDNFNDLVLFWNLRAIGGEMYFLPITDKTRFKEFIQKYIDSLSDRLLLLADSVHIYFAQGRDLQSVKECFSQFTLPASKKAVLSPCDKETFNGLSGSPWVYHLDSTGIVGIVDKTPTTTTIHIPLPPKDFIEKTNQELILHVSSPFDWAYPNATLNPPRIHQLTEFYGREIGFEPYMVRGDSDGIRVLTNSDEANISLRPISYIKIVNQLFHELGITAEYSQAGTIANRLIDHMGGLDSCRIFKIRGVRNLINSIKHDEAITLGKATEQIWNNEQFKDHQQLCIESETKPTADNVFRYMLGKSLFQAGLDLYCSSCNLENWFSINDLQDTWTCQFCGHKEKIALQLKDRGDWRFRKSGLLAKDNNQEGAIPVILTLWRFMMSMHEGIIYTPSLNLHIPGKACETDFCLINKIRDGHTEIAIGECKSAGGRIDRKDIENLTLIREKISSIGIACYLVFTKSDGAFLPEEIELFKELKSKYIPVILLTNTELDFFGTYDPLKEDVKKKLRHPFSLSDFAANSQLLYLS